ncbi:hypothetical protein [Pseudomonas sp. Q12-87]|uniref:hypothetical protein n=1 Tax=Pseudomonas sp. Q12-87 TaxID=177989 RepID=UPI00069E1452|nr:hypothetical protein [Pseudomonas sp. Q12-87]
MNHNEYGHDFEDGGRNGWENDTGSLDGILKTEEEGGRKNTFWSGKLEWKSPYPFMPSLAKIFTFSGGEEEKGSLLTTFKYRVHPPEPGEATEMTVVVTKDISLGWSAAFTLGSQTPTGKWLQSRKITTSYFGGRSHILIGAHFGEVASRKVDIDDIEVVRVSQ